MEDLVEYYRRHLYTVNEIVGFLIFRHHYLTSKRTVERILKRLNIRLRERESPLPELIVAIQELHSSGYCESGYRTVWRILNSSCGLRATQGTVRAINAVLDPSGVHHRTAHRFRRRTYGAMGPNGVVHIDGYDKLKPFGIAIHGAICGYSRKILWLKACPSNNDPKRVAFYFLDYLKSIRGLPRTIRTDAGTENVVIRAIQIALRMHHGDVMSGYRSAITGRSTSNQRIEMLWGFLRRAIIQFWRNLFIGLVDENMLNNTDPVHLECVRFCFLPVVQDSLDTFRNTWNSHRIRPNRLAGHISGIPDVLYYQPLLQGSMDCKFDLPLNLDELNEIQESFTTPMPFRGCSDDFVTLVEHMTGTQRGEFDSINTPNQSKLLYETLIELINQQNE